MLIEDVDLIQPEKTLRRPANARRKMSFRLGARRAGSERFTRKELRLFSTSLGSLFEGGIPLLRSLQVIRQESAKRQDFARVIARVEERVRQGHGFSEALAKEPASFPVFFTQMVEAGELSGTLDTILPLLSSYLEKEEERRRKIIEAASYPGMVLVLGVVTFAVLLKFVIPKIVSVYDDFGSELPALTRWVLAASDLVVPITAVLFAACTAGLFFLRRRKDWLSAVCLRIPLFGNLLKKNLLSFFSSLLALELKSGIPILTALESVQGTVSWSFYRNDIARVRENLMQGGGFAENLRNLSWIPQSSCLLIQAGQESGRLPEALEQVHREAGREFETQVHFLLKILEPLLILAVGGLVGLVVISAILPILEINTLVR
mgnify:CR=1 FL=1